MDVLELLGVVPDWTERL